MNIFQIAKAQGADDLTSPTIPFTPPVGPLTPVPTEIVTGPSIQLQTNVVSVKKGEKALIEVVVYTNRQEIKSFKFKVKYDPTVLKVVDTDGTKSGTQINYQNTFFDQKSNSVNESNGEITLEAGSDQGTTTVTSRVVASFEVEGLKEGSSQISIVKADSNLISYLNADILQTVNSVVLNVSNQSIVITHGPTKITPSKVTPKTGIIDDLGYSNALIIGAVLVACGIYLFKKRKSNDLL